MLKSLTDLSRAQVLGSMQYRVIPKERRTFVIVGQQQECFFFSSLFSFRLNFTTFKRDTQNQLM